MKLILPVICMFVGLLFIVLGPKMFYSMWQFKKSAIKITATVIDIKTSTSRTHRITYSPVLTYQTPDGQKMVYDVSRFYFRTYNIGEQVDILYNKDNPISPQVNSFKQLFLTPIAIILMALFYLGLSFWLFRRN